MSRPDDLLEEEWADDDYLDDPLDDYEGPQEPHCFACMDTGLTTRYGLYLGTFDGPPPRPRRAGRDRCPDCSPSPRQRRRWPLRLRRLSQVGEKLQRDAARRRARGELDDESPF